MSGVLSRILALFCGWKGSSDDEDMLELRLLEGESKQATLDAVVTNVSDDCGLMNDPVSFTNDDVTDNEPLKSRQTVIAVIKEEETSQEFKALKVEAFHEDTGVSNAGLNLFGCATPQFISDCVVNHLAYFSVDVVCKGFEPYEGDWIEVEFSVQRGTNIRKPVCVRPLAHKHVYEVYITDISGRRGEINKNTFFSLDSLKLPAGYTPHVSDAVNAILVRSTYMGYAWRALSLSPVGELC